MSWVEEAVWLDFESLPLEPKPARLPVPVGLAIRWPGERRARYLSWGHPSGNTSTYEAARAELAKVWESGRPIAGHNMSKFDHPLAVDRFDLPALPWQRVHDTLYQLFLDDPRAPNYQLKPSAERLLGRKPEERDALVDHVIAEQPIPGKRLGHARGDNYAGAYVAFAPVSVAGPYACADVDLARDLGRAVWRRIERAGMGAAYDRERQLVPVLLDMETQGVRVDLERLGADVERYERQRRRLVEWLCARLGVGDDFNLDSGQQLADALIAAGLATQASLGVTRTGKTQTNKVALENGVSDPQVLAALRYKGSLDTCLDTFMTPWLRTAEASGGLIFSTWHSTRNDHGKDGAGAGTGRLSSTPNFQNLAKTFRAFFAPHARARVAALRTEIAEAKDAPTRAALEAERTRLAALPEVPFRGLDPLPVVRGYVVPYEKGWGLADVDANQQELRLTAHYEDGELRDAYRRDEWLDFHDFARNLILERSGKLYPRTQVKVTGFRILYGSGAKALAEALGLGYGEAKDLMNTYLDALGGVRALDETLRTRFRRGQPLRTFGGRVYHCEPPRWVIDKKTGRGRWADFAYRALNLLIQGSASDATKLAMLHYAEHKPKHHRLVLTVHDQLVASCPAEEKATAIRQLHEAIDHVPLDVPMRSDAKWTETNWAEVRPYDKKGKLVARAA